ncbi:uncharacterized protein PAC_04019 [Phialocephala subalpina]|uniref:Uncharacterized protein n=1 Tax=Phialocephala subalpina TaxID=576137 RepID=A0A1L7WN05_9HELO|nr:uncharacterized protein PAC_04019 [Phialocephala subalpina]
MGGVRVEQVKSAFVKVIFPGEGLIELVKTCLESVAQTSLFCEIFQNNMANHALDVEDVLFSIRSDVAISCEDP